MNKSICTLIAVLIAVTATAASRRSSHLTLQRVHELTAPTAAPEAKSYRIEISDLGQTVVQPTGPEGQITLLRESISPTDFAPAQAVQTGNLPFAVVPSTPISFERFKTGWTVRLSVKPLGKLVAVSGIADYIEANDVPAGYGAVAGPIYFDQTGTTLVSANVMKMAKVQTTTTRFQIFAVPGEEYEVTFYRGEKAEKHRVSLFAD